jgi:hypothetical protein
MTKIITASQIFLSKEEIEKHKEMRKNGTFKPDKVFTRDTSRPNIAIPIKSINNKE